MRKKTVILILLIPFLAAAGFYLLDEHHYKNNEIKFQYPWKRALFPADFSVPSFNWADTSNPDQLWTINIYLESEKDFISQKVTETCWIPEVDEWERIKENSGYKDIRVIVRRAGDGNTPFLKPRAELTIAISEDSVNAPLLYREIPLPFSFAEQNANFMSFAALNVADPDGSYPVLEKFRVCGNCHSLSENGSKIALDFDASLRDKGGYFIADVDSVITFSKDNYLSWSKILGKSTFGMLSKISWDGKYVVTSVKDRAISEKFSEPGKISYSQLFFPVNGVLAVYNTKSGELNELPGANSLEYVQSNAIWTPMENS